MKVPIGKDVNDFLMHYLGKRKKPKEKMQSREHSRQENVLPKSMKKKINFRKKREKNDEKI